MGSKLRSKNYRDARRHVAIYPNSGVLLIRLYHLWEIGVNRVFTAVTQPLETGQPGVRQGVAGGSPTKVIG